MSILNVGLYHATKVFILLGDRKDRLNKLGISVWWDGGSEFGKV